MSERTVIVHNPNNLRLVNINDLKELQGNLKDLTAENYEKLKRSILKHGFFVPIFTWNGYILDGHGRKRVLTKENWNIEVPVVDIEADNIDDAKEKLLSITSQYQTITIEGIDEFYPNWQELDVNFDAIHSFDTKDSKEEEKDSNKEDIGEDTITCPNCQHVFIHKSKMKGVV